ncbi:MAG: DNA primase [Bacteroidetes bacterium]|nr:MAG: DNA primase [Bacteroidota bacterium]
MPRIPQKKIDEIYNAIDLVDIISDYVQLKKKGQNYWALSPFTNEKTPSFAVNPVKGIYKCFSSGKGGNAVNFLMEMEGYTYVEALKHIARKYGIEVQEEIETPEARAERDKRQSLYIVNEFASRYFHEQLLHSPEGQQIGLSYFRERGILQHTIEAFQLGYAPDKWDAFVKEAADKQYNEAYLLELGLVSKSQKTGKLIDRFRGRVMFPITNAVGKVVGFGGRILGNQKEIAKYINSSESDIYHKSQVLYGLYQAKKAIRDADLCILTEGYMDTIALYQNGIQNVVASSGTALTVEQVRLIRRFTKQVLMIYDGDAAGLKAANRGVDLLIKEGMQARVLILPDGHDPDSYVKAVGKSAFLAYMEQQAMNFVDFKLHILQQEGAADTPEHQTRVIKGMAASLALLPDPIQQQVYVKHVAQKLDISEGLMSQAVAEALGEQQKLEARERRRKVGQQQQADLKELKAFEQMELASQEKELIRVLANYPDQSFVEGGKPLEDEAGNPIEQELVPLIEFFMVELEGLQMENQLYEQLKQAIFEDYQQQGYVRVNKYLEHPNQDIRKIVAELLIPVHEISPNWRQHGAFDLDLDGDLERSVKSPMYHYKFRKVEKLLMENQQQLKEAEKNGDLSAADELFSIYVHLKQIHKQIGDKLGTQGAIKGHDGRL